PAVRLADVDPCRAGEIAEMRAVPGRDLAQISGADQTAGAVQVLHHHVRMAVDVLDQVFGEQAALDVGRAAGSEVDQHGEALALVERLLRLRGRHCQRSDCAEPEQGGTDRAQSTASASAWERCAYSR